MSLTSLRVTLCAGALLLMLLASPGVFADEMKEVVVEKYGYKLKIPAQFEVEDKIDKTTTWMFQPGSAPAAREAAPKGKKRGGLLGGLGKIVEDAVGTAGGDAAAGAGASGGGLEPALTIYVNWTWMPDVSDKVSYDANLKQTREDIESPDPDYQDVQIFDKKKGYAYEGYAYWFKEVDKSDPDEIHRWHIKAFGNKSHYTIGLCGTYAQFEKWGPIYEEVIKSFELIPLKSE